MSKDMEIMDAGQGEACFSADIKVTHTQKVKHTPELAHQPHSDHAAQWFSLLWGCGV